MGRGALGRDNQQEHLRTHAIAHASQLLHRGPPSPIPSAVQQSRDRVAKVLTLSNSGHFIALLEAFGMSNSTPSQTPMVSGSRLHKTGENLLPKVTRCADLVGSLLYL